MRKKKKLIYSVFLALLASRCSPFDPATGNDFLKWFLMVSDIIYSTLEQSCNVLNYTKLSELVAQKESSMPMGITSVLLLTATCLHGSAGRNEGFRFSKAPRGRFGGELKQIYDGHKWILHSEAREVYKPSL